MRRRADGGDCVDVLQRRRSWRSEFAIVGLAAIPVSRRERHKRRFLDSRTKRRESSGK
jgi:hypothetical protein